MSTGCFPPETSGSFFAPVRTIRCTRRKLDFHGAVICYRSWTKLLSTKNLTSMNRLSFHPDLAPPANPTNVNEVLFQTVLPGFLCPSDRRSRVVSDTRLVVLGYENLGAASYVGNYGVNGFVNSPRPEFHNLSWHWLSFQRSTWTPNRYQATASWRNHKGNGPLGTNSDVRFRDVLDGTSQCVFLGERHGFANDSPGARFYQSRTLWGASVRTFDNLGSAYYRPNECTPTRGRPDRRRCNGQMSSSHDGGINVCLIDGSVRLISSQIDSASTDAIDAVPSMMNGSRSQVWGVWQALCEINDGKTIGEY